ncbi:maleylpyruvate isomerase family mycothiol-dependent enzyme [Nocardioides sp. CFH 31398]|uniref:maleylpyruvate isomerase family mycothiol-dependent enzyme n=1 Tax=Nocardioides sp. CFH 31398 TaxID=2919579 RepID=UPI001F06BC7E|nr:maleylpyruvate isomerase family mycothiol-dependent enzyme [Nocardioides sp. CFH 31398]MCH1868426.1 maleylpyruvate isomerase family mycothiol-dependent enzyme [Nocardioides sp. CFH 31398]
MTSTSSTTGTTGGTAAAFRERADRFAAALDLAGGRGDATTPCDGWTVADVVAHVVDTERDFLDRHGLPVPAPSGDDPGARWRAHADAVAAVLTEDVAARPYDGYFGPTTIGATMADFYGWDLEVHAWDVAVAAGASYEIPDADTLSRLADGWGPALHSEGICGPPVPVPDDASASDRLLGRLGRDPRWSPDSGS